MLDIFFYFSTMRCLRHLAEPLLMAAPLPIDVGHGEKGSGVGEHSFRPLARFWLSSPAKVPTALAAHGWQRRFVTRPCQSRNQSALAALL
jgi:hypothetical protein